VGYLWWLSDSEQGGGWERRRGHAMLGQGKGEHSTRRCAPLIGARGGGRWRGKL
jgi:hypothetical protein